MQRLFLILGFILISSTALSQTFYAKDLGIVPNTGDDYSIKLTQVIDSIAKQSRKAKIILEKGRYDFFPSVQNERTYYISNHDQVNPKNVGIAIENVKNITIEGSESDFVYHGRMLPISIVNCKNITLNGIFVDFEKPHIAQAQIVANDTVNKKITFKFAPWVDFELRDSVLYNVGNGWQNALSSAIAFEAKSKRIVYNTSDVYYGKRHAVINADSTVTANWDNKQMLHGTVLAFRSWYRPSPGIFVTDSKDIKLHNVFVHYAEGMGLLAQMSENIYLDNFNVCLKGQDDKRYFTTQADATHFSGCKGIIDSRNGFYESMMDDAINVHGTYLKIIKVIDKKTIVAKYMHGQAWGFRWGEKGDKVQFISSNTMEIIERKNVIEKIVPVGDQGINGVKEFQITFINRLNIGDPTKVAVGVENLTWTPKVEFVKNVIRNNRARGSLFSTPKKVVVKMNQFDHTSGTAILLCGDCNGWYETGACTNVIIKQNMFVNSLTNMFQFTNAVISIYPEIPNLKDQTKFFHSNIKIYNNKFVTFDKPILYAKSVDGIFFKHNVIETNSDYPAFHPIKSVFLFEKTKNVKLFDNKFDFVFDPSKEIVYR